MNCKQVNEISIIDYLKSIGFLPQRVSSSDYWYYSPFREETSASFKVNCDKNIYYDHGEGEGGRLIDFICRYNNCNVRQALEIVNSNTFSFHQQKQRKLKLDVAKSTYSIISVSSITDLRLIEYLRSRGISSSSFVYIDEMLYKYSNSAELHKAICFKNNSNGFELRRKESKVAFLKKDISTIIESELSEVYVFEGFFDFLSFRELRPNRKTNYVILNSITLAKIAIEEIRKLKYSEVYLFFDNDSSGRKVTKLFKSKFQRAVDYSFSYKKFKDLNDFLIAKIGNN